MGSSRPLVPQSEWSPRLSTTQTSTGCKTNVRKVLRSPDMPLTLKRVVFDLLFAGSGMRGRDGRGGATGSVKRERSMALENRSGSSGGQTAKEKSRGLESVAQGNWGEDVASRFLKDKGWRIVGRRVRPCRRDRRCEIDIIAFDPGAGRIVFVEVKAHAARSPFANRLWGVDRRKKRVLLRACATWLQREKWHGNFRFDVVEVYGSRASSLEPAIDHLENVPLFGRNWRFW